MSEKQLRRGCFKFILFYFVVAIVFYFVAGEQIQTKDVVSIDTIDQAIQPVGELYDGMSIEQSFVAETQQIDSVDLYMATYQRMNQGTMKVEIIAEEAVIGSKEVDTSTIQDNSILPVIFESPLMVEKGEELKIRVTSNTFGVENAITLYKTDKEICMRVSGKEELLLGKYYTVWTGGLGVIMAAYCLNLIHKQKTGKNSRGLSLIQAFSKYRFLLDQLVARDFKTKYKRSFLGVMWSFLNPLLTMMVQYIVFSTLFKSDIANYPVYLLTGVIFFNFFSEATNMALMSIVSNAALITKVYVPKYIYPIARIISSIINLLLSLIPLLIVVVLTGTSITWAYLLLPFPLLCMLAFCLGIGFILSSAMVFFRDTQFLWGVVSMMWMYATPIFYPETIIPQSYMVFYKMNPLYHIIRFTRTILIDGISPEPQAYLFCLIASFGTLAIGAWIFKKSQDRFVLHI